MSVKDKTKENSILKNNSILNWRKTAGETFIEILENSVWNPRICVV